MTSQRIIIWVAALTLLLASGLCCWVYWRSTHQPRRHGFPLGIVIHHTATPPYLNGKLVNVATIDAMHAARAFHVVDPKTGKVYHIGYHFLVLQNGAILHGRPEYLPGAHAKGHPQTLGIALVGNFQRSSNRGECGPCTPPPAQLHSLIWLTRYLMAKYQLTPAEVYLHRDLRQTACPGDAFPREQFYHAITHPGTPEYAVKP